VCLALGLVWRLRLIFLGGGRPLYREREFSFGSLYLSQKFQKLTDCDLITSPSGINYLPLIILPPLILWKFYLGTAITATAMTVMTATATFY
jgi:hypothetical protein